MPRRTLVRGRGPLRPTYARELLLARKYVDLPQLLGLAFRQHRRDEGMSQRAYADFRGWSKGRQGRLEASAGELRLDVLIHALAGTGFALTVVREDGREAEREDDRDAGREGSCDAVRVSASTPLTGQSALWLDSEFIAQDDAGRKFPAHVAVRRTAHPPWWWQRLHSTTGRFIPEWTTQEELRAADRTRTPLRRG